jgi:hypothetical protein
LARNVHPVDEQFDGTLKPLRKRYQLRIDGQSVDPLTLTWFETHNPYTGEAWAEIPRADARTSIVRCARRIVH